LRSSETFFISLFLALAEQALFFSTVEGQTPVRIMPLGNSITDDSGSSHDGGYRRDLYDLLQNAGIAFDFVGSRQTGADLPDRDHEGHPGFPASQLDVQNYLVKAKSAAGYKIHLVDIAARFKAVSNWPAVLKSGHDESGWVITRNAYAARNTAVTIKVSQPSDDGNLGMSPTYHPASPYGIYDQANWYRFYTYRNGSDGPYRLYAAWKKNGIDGGRDVTGDLTINGAVYLHLRFDTGMIHFEASLDGATWKET
jgi:hypothetical protein